MVAEEVGVGLWVDLWYNFKRSAGCPFGAFLYIGMELLYGLCSFSIVVALRTSCIKLETSAGLEV